MQVASLAACFTVVTEWAGPAAGTVTEVVAHWSAAIGTTAGLHLIKTLNDLNQRELIIALFFFAFLITTMARKLAGILTLLDWCHYLLLQHIETDAVTL